MTQVMPNKQPSRHIPLPGTYNIRDLGGYATRMGRQTRWHRLLRADSPHNLSAEARDELLKLGVNTVIDLRNADELEQSPNPFANHDGVKYLNVPLFAGLSRAGTQPSSLIQIYQTALEHSQIEFRTVLRQVAESDGVTLFHCTAGKDRTGLIAALVLGTLEVSDEQIIEDYALTSSYIQPLLETLREDALAKGHDLAWYNQLLTSEPNTMQVTLEHLQTQYGGAQGYLEMLGVKLEVEKLRHNLLEDVVKSA
jgi:protein-tyrosine phosphatase